MSDDDIYTSYKTEQHIYATWPKELNTWGDKNTSSLSPPKKPPLPPKLPPKLPPPRSIPPAINREQKPLSTTHVFKKGYIEEYY